MKSLPIVWAVATSVVIAIAALVAVYAWNFRALPISTNDAASWGQFGDYVGGLLNPLVAILNLGVVMYIAIGLQRHWENEKKRSEEKDARVRLAVQLYAEWNSEAIYVSRVRAWRVLRDSASATIFEIEQQQSGEAMSHVWVVVGFLQRLGVLAEHGKLDNRLAIEFFGELIGWWWTASFEHQLAKSDFSASQRIKTLWQWVCDNSTPEQRVPWISRAAEDREKALRGDYGPQFFVA